MKTIVNYLISAALLMTSLMCFSADFVAGKDYQVINAATPSPNSHGIINVTEFFSFGCPWCYRLEPALNHWVQQQGAKIHFKKIPVIFNKDWDYYARAYYTAEALSLNSTLDPRLFKAILDDKQRLNNQQAMVDFLIKNGVNRATAESAFNHSPSIELNIANSQRTMASCAINAVPAVVLNNKYKTDLQMAGTEDRFFAILDYLISLSSK